MPATSAKQKRLMDAAAHNKEFAKTVGIPQKVAKEYSKESKGLKFKEGGQMKSEMKKVATKAVKGHEARMHGKKMAAGGETKAMVKKEIDFMKKKGAPKSMIKHEQAEAKMARGGGIESRGKTKGTMVKMAAGGSVSKRADGIAKKGKTSCKVM